MKNGFTLIELLAVLVILAIIALIAVPIVLNIIRDSKEESNKRSIEMYAKALKNSIAKYQLDGKKFEVSKLETIDGRNFSNIDDFKVEYDGNVVCEIIEVYGTGNIYLENCKVNGENKVYTYGKRAVFAEDSWETIAKNVKAGYMYNVGDTKEIKLEDFTNLEPGSKGLYTVRIANNSNPDECNMEGFSQSACGFVVEFVDIIITHRMNSENTNVGGYPNWLLYTYLYNDIYNSFSEDLMKVIIDTKIVSGHGVTIGETNFVTEDKIYLLSPKEVLGNASYDTSADQTRQLDYYRNQTVTSVSPTITYSSAIKNYNGSPEYWWLRSALSHSTYGIYFVNVNGAAGSYFAVDNRGVAPAFRIG